MGHGRRLEDAILSVFEPAPRTGNASKVVLRMAVGMAVVSHSIENTLRAHASLVIGKVSVDRVELHQVLRILKPIGPTRKEAASRLRAGTSSGS